MDIFQTLVLPRSKRLAELDALRGIAALAVVLFHLTSHYNKTYGHSQDLLFSFPYGVYGVEAFFIISGFVILMTLNRTKRGLDFIVSRFSRLYPTYWACVLLTATALFIYNPFVDKNIWQVLLINMTMFQHFFDVENIDDSYWTLGVELGFYIIMFAIYKANLLKHLEKILIVWVAISAVGAVLKKLSLVPLNSKLFTFLLLGHPGIGPYANVFIIGMMLYLINMEGISNRRCGIIAACLLVYKINHTLSETVLLSLFTIALYRTIKGKMSLLKFRPLVFLGTISYPLYLLHQQIGFIIINFLENIGMNSNVSVLIAIAFAVFLASIITFLVEIPSMHWIREKYRYRQIGKSI